MTLTEFLLARITEDEAAVSRFEDRSSSPHASHGSDSVGTFARWCPTCLAGWPGREQFLTECEAKRRIIHEHPMMPTGALMTERHCSGYEEEAISEGWWPCPTLRALALPYADHPDYRMEWKP